MLGEAAGVSAATDGRYQALLRISSAIAEQPSLNAVLGSLRAVLSNIAAFDSVDLFLLSDDNQTLHLIAFDRSPDLPGANLGTTVASTISVVDRVINQQQMVYIADLARELSNIPEFASLASRIGSRNGYVFPVSTSRRRFGLLFFGKAQGQEVAPEDMELMGSVASHVAIAVESALAIDRAEHYQRDLAKQRDRLRLLLEINNHLVSKLDINDLFCAASASIRAYFGSDLTGFWVVDKESNRLQRMALDFPATKGFLAETDITELREQDWEKLRAHRAEIWSAVEIDELPSRIAATLRAESIVSVAAAPMVTGSGPLGLLAMGSRKASQFGQHDLDLLSQISVQISLALDNALAYGRLGASAARWKRNGFILNRKSGPNTTSMTLLEKALPSGRCWIRSLSWLRQIRRCFSMARPVLGKNWSQERFTA